MNPLQFSMDDDADVVESINIDDLYERKKQSDLNKLALFKKMLARIHVRIKTVARTTKDNFCWFVVPEVMLGVPRFDHAGCVAYLVHTLQTNGFRVQYFHPNMLFICWEHWVPMYVRQEIKKRTGITVDAQGRPVREETEEDEEGEDEGLTLNAGTGGGGGSTGLGGGGSTRGRGGATNTNTNNGAQFTPIQAYRPSGSLVYSRDLMHRLQHKLAKDDER